ncbi:pirin family protein [Micromonosporaceae bacterium DT194]|uniref:pirin family protein n=1 Tax=Melissospora conviva TaxID=3388432 RepID=UPI003C29399A
MESGQPAASAEENALDQPRSVLLPGHDVPLGRYSVVRRLLPQRDLRMVGAWCFVDHFGPDDVHDRPGMQVAPHPHTGLQTVTWLLDGQIRHRDSVGSDQLIRPGQLNVMTSGHGIAHSEQSPQPHPPLMHGVQLWVALPRTYRDREPAFDHHPELPAWTDGPVTVRLLVGELGGLRSPAVVHSPLVGAQLEFAADGELLLAADPCFEYGILALSGAAQVADCRLVPGALLHLAPGAAQLRIRGAAGSRVLLLGGEPFDEPLVMWWNFVAGSHEEIVRAREDWMAGRRFGAVCNDPMDPLPAPAMPAVRLKARDRHGRGR